MVLEKMSVTTELTKIQCGNCGGVYAISERYRRNKEERGGSWTCPYCRCGWGYSQESSLLEKAERKAKQYSNWLAREKAEHDQTKMSLRAQKGAKTKLKNRISQGICPCCNKRFEDLKNHMLTEHPEFLEKD